MIKKLDIISSLAVARNEDVIFIFAKVSLERCCVIELSLIRANAILFNHIHANIGEI